MTESSDYNRTVKYTKATDEKLQKMADQVGRTKRDFFIQMVEYFYKTKKDPKDINDELLKKTLLKNHLQSRKKPTNCFKLCSGGWIARKS